MSDGDQRTYKVTGMTCEHCVRAVSTGVSELAGVGEVEVDLAGGTVVVRGSAIDDEAVRAAVEAAGYGISSTPNLVP